jgi:hypothetical protein
MIGWLDDGVKSKNFVWEAMDGGRRERNRLAQKWKMPWYSNVSRR